MSEQKPLPCPFCGKLPEWSTSREDNDKTFVCNIACLNFRCGVRPVLTLRRQQPGDRLLFNMAVRRWNTRR